MNSNFKKMLFIFLATIQFLQTPSFAMDTHQGEEITDNQADIDKVKEVAEFISTALTENQNTEHQNTEHQNIDWEYHIDYVRNLLKKINKDNWPITLNEKYAGGKTLLHMAAEKGLNDAVLSMLTNWGQDLNVDLINVFDAFGASPLHYAARYCNLRIVQAFFQEGQRDDLIKNNLLPNPKTILQNSTNLKTIIDCVLARPFGDTEKAGIRDYLNSKYYNNENLSTLNKTGSTNKMVQMVRGPQDQKPSDSKLWLAIPAGLLVLGAGAAIATFAANKQIKKKKKSKNCELDSKNITLETSGSGPAETMQGVKQDDNQILS